MLYSRTGDYPPKQPMLFAEDFSPNTVQGACPTCHGLGRVYEVTEKSMVPDDSLTIRERAIAAWPPAWHGQNLRDILVTLGYDVDTPWRDLPKKDRDWILFTDEQPTVPVYAGLTPKETRAALKRKDEPSYQGTFTGARRYVLHTFANTQSALMKKRVSQYHGRQRLPGLPWQAAQEGSAVGEIRRARYRRVLAVAARRTRRRCSNRSRAANGPSRTPHRAKTGKGSVLSKSAMRDAVDKRVAAGGSAHKASPDVRRTPNLSEEKRVAAQRIAAELLERLTTLVDLGLGYLALERSTPTLVVRRTAALATRHAAVVAVVRRRVCARRAIGRPASRRWRSALQRAAGPEGGGQFAVRRRARSADDAARRLAGRCRSGGRRSRRSCGL